MGQNLYTKGACYAAMEYARMNRVGDYLYAGPDMIEQNMGMEMIIPRSSGVLSDDQRRCQLVHGPGGM